MSSVVPIKPQSQEGPVSLDLEGMAYSVTLPSPASIVLNPACNPAPPLGLEVFFPVFFPQLH